jgi:hypothetical protein
MVYIILLSLVYVIESSSINDSLAPLRIGSVRHITLETSIILIKLDRITFARLINL